MVLLGVPKQTSTMDCLALRKIQLGSRKLRDELIASPYTSVGCYPMFAITSDGGALCKNCCKSESRSIGLTYGNDSWQVVSLDINYENKDLYCDHCSQPIECAYSD